MTGSRLFTLLLLAPLCGCGLFQSRADRALHASPDYKAGYSDGCSSAQDGARARDDAAFAANAAYRTGWREGYGGCRMMSLPGPSMTPPR